MGGLSVGEDEELFGKRQNGDYWTCSPVHAHHRRSRSASDRNGDVRGLRVPHSLHNNQNLPHESPLSTRTYSTQTPSHGHSIDSNTSSSNHRASLEKDIQLLQLRLQQEKSMRITLERAIGRASSTLSPGHRHFASQTKELIAEIDLLEEEVANRERHVLSLYRSIFDHCVSRPPSEQSSGMNSPAQVKNKTRRHPSIISSAFCSSKKFPLRSFQSLSSKSSSGRKELKTRHNSLPAGKAAPTCTNSAKVQKKSPPTEKTSMQRTLKDHLGQCPSKLSEEMVRCMAAVYCWLFSNPSSKSENNEESMLSEPSANIVLSQECSQEGHPCKSFVEISSIPTDKSKFSRASYAINSYRVLVEQLERVNVNQMESKAQMAFWINVYNSLVMHAYLAYGIPHSSLRKLALFHKAAYNIGGHIISANAIEHAIFGFHTPRVGGWLETILSTALRKKSGEERHAISSKFGLPNSQSLVCFALCTGAFSDPVLKVYMASNVKDELEWAKREFLHANIVVKKSRKVFLPKLLERLAREASIGPDDLLKWVCENVDRKLRDSIHKCVDSQTNRKASQIIEWLPFSSKFRYVMSNELAAKPWWL
ncbi:hypothetical protein Nepgr_011386 [Nepenthes gracilis]|uniref:Uncharacterized protein n=1 Tax=Nepenthes gracilis TaxID=150966 RepID=A0AAD3SDZ0_NEPGR|nr:hypothetical protein Nepgr_011386 [Nepenthes gracilis]